MSRPEADKLMVVDHSWLETEPMTQEETVAAHAAIKERENMTSKATVLSPEVATGIVKGGTQIITPPTPMSLMQQAVGNGASVEALAKLMDLQLRWEQNEARKAFEEAFAKFKAEAPKLEKTKEVSFGANKTAYKYTPLDHIANTLGPILAKHDLSYNWTQESGEGVITVTCILRHVAGHSIGNTLSATADPSGSKNAIQAIGSAVSYLRRYTLLGVLGMATSDEDTDGVLMDNAQDFILNIEAASDMDELKRAYTEAARAALKDNDTKALKMFMGARDTRKQELAAQ